MARYNREHMFLGQDTSVMSTSCLDRPGLCMLVDANSVRPGRDNRFKLLEFFRGRGIFRIDRIVPFIEDKKAKRRNSGPF